MSRRKRMFKTDRAEKKSVDVPPSKDLVDGNTNADSSTINSTTNDLVNQAISEDQDKLKGRHFAYVVYPESAPADWIEQMKGTGLAFVISPLHDKDVNADGTPKKAHYHMIVSWGNTTTYRSARGLCGMLHCPMPQMLRSPNGMYRYLTHKDNPEKYQYSEQPEAYNGWIRPLDSGDVSALKAEIWQMVYTEDCQEYNELLTVCHMRGPEYFEVCSNNTLFFKAICDGYRNNPVRCLARYVSMLDEGEERESIAQTIGMYAQYQAERKGR